MRRSVHRSNERSSKTPPSYEIFDDDIDDFDEDYEHGRYNSKKNEVYDENLVEGLLGLMKSLKMEKKKYKSRNREKQHVSSEELDTAFDLENYSELEEEKQRSLAERENLQQEQKHIQKVHNELCDINHKLQHENKRLRQWDFELRERESSLDRVEQQLSSYAASLEETIQKQVGKQCKIIEEECECKIQQVQEEMKKTRNSFKIMKKANETLKKKTQSDDAKLKVLEEKQSALHNRIINLQRKNEILQEQLKDSLTSSLQTFKEPGEKDTRKKDNFAGKAALEGTFYDVFSTLLHWIAEVQLKSNVKHMLKASSHVHTEHDVLVEATNERCMKILSSLPSILHDISSMNNAFQLSFVHFVYWSLLHAHLTQSSQKFTHSATYRRIGEEFYGSQHTVKTVKETPSKVSFFRSHHLKIRLLSSLVILHTVSKADIVAYVFQTLSADLRHELAKDVFVENHGTALLFPFFKWTNKIHLEYSIDVLMILCADSPYLQAFLTSLSSVEWIQSIVSMMKSSLDDNSLLEKLSLLLQRLSKLRCNKAILDALQVYNVVTELHRTCDPRNEFLQLNLRSILFNIDAMKTQKD